MQIHAGWQPFISISVFITCFLEVTPNSEIINKLQIQKASQAVVV